MVDSCRVLLPLLAVTLLCTAVRWKDLLPLGPSDVNNEKQEVIHIALGATVSVMPGMAATMRSVLLNTHSQVVFHLFVTNTDEAIIVRKMLECVGIGEEWLGTLKVFPPQNYFTAVVAADLAASTNFVRLFLGQELPSSVSKVLWLDSDTIVQKDIKELWDMLSVSPESKWTVAAVERRAGYKTLDYTLGGRIYNNSLRFQAAFQLRYPSRKISEIDFSRMAFNAGVLLLNLDHLRANGSYLMEEMLWWSKRNSEEVLWGGGSQPLANLLALLSPAGDYKHLNPTWNVCGDTMRDPQEWNAERGILHWTISGDRSKPWRYDLRQQAISLWLPHGLPAMECYRFLKLPEK